MDWEFLFLNPQSILSCVSFHLHCYGDFNNHNSLKYSVICVKHYIRNMCEKNTDFYVLISCSKNFSANTDFLRFCRHLFTLVCWWRRRIFFLVTENFNIILYLVNIFSLLPISSVQVGRQVIIITGKFYQIALARW